MYIEPVADLAPWATRETEGKPDVGVNVFCNCQHTTRGCQ